MTIQEEIKEGIRNILQKADKLDRLMFYCECKECLVDQKYVLDKILKFLDSKGMVKQGIEATTDRPGYHRYTERLI